MTEPLVCSKCGATNYLQTGACWRCGHRFDSEAPTPASQAGVEPVSDEPQAAELDQPTQVTATSEPVVLPEERVVADPEPPPPLIEAEELPDLPAFTPPQQSTEASPEFPIFESRDPSPTLAANPSSRLELAPQPAPGILHCANCGAALHEGAFHCWMCGAETPAYTPEVKQHYHWQERERQWREREATMRTFTELDGPKLPQAPQVEVSARFVRAMAIGFGLCLALAILNPLLGRLLSSLSFPFNIIVAPLTWLSGCGAALAIPFLLALIVAAIARDANKSKIQ